MLIAFVAAAHERERALRIANWIEELGAGKNHDVLLCLTRLAAGSGLREELEPILSRAFASCAVFVPHDSVEIPWGAPLWDASSANHLFKRINTHINQNIHVPYLYLEMDAVLTRATAFDEVDSEYKVNGKPFMGDRVNNGRHPIHMSGVAVYPTDILNYSVRLASIDWNCQPVQDPKRGKQAWDIASGSDVVPMAHFTALIQHVYQQPGSCNAKGQWNGQAAIFHQCKCGCLIERLREETKRKVAPVDPEQAFESAAQSHVDALRELATNPERYEWIIGRLRGGLFEALNGQTAPKSEEQPKNGKGKRHLSPEHKAKLLAALARAREAKRLAKLAAA